MALTGPGVTAAIIAAGPTLNGPKWFGLATAVGSAFSKWVKIRTNVLMQGVTAGAIGAGTVTGKPFVVPVSLPVSAALTASAFTGMQANLVATAIGMGVANSINSQGQYTGQSAGVGAGTDVSSVRVAVGAALGILIAAELAGRGYTGQQVPLLSTALGSGIAGIVKTTSGLGGVAGGAGPLPASGTSFSGLF